MFGVFMSTPTKQDNVLKKCPYKTRKGAPEGAPKGRDGEVLALDQILLGAVGGADCHVARRAAVRGVVRPCVAVGLYNVRADAVDGLASAVACHDLRRSARRAAHVQARRHHAVAASYDACGARGGARRVRRALQ